MVLIYFIIFLFSILILNYFRQMFLKVFAWIQIRIQTRVRSELSATMVNLTMSELNITSF
jgi:hypothetical protein